HFVVLHGWDRKGDRWAPLAECQQLTSSQSAHALDGLCRVKLHLLTSDGVEAPERPTHRVRISIVQKVQRVTRFGPPGKNLDQPVSPHRDGRSVCSAQPADGFLEQSAEIGVA